MIRVECLKCGGRGNISAYANILGGVCFSCNGRGYITQKHAPRPGKRFTISAVERATGERITVFTVKARSEAEALRKAVATLRRGNGYLPESAAIVYADAAAPAAHR